MTSNTSSLPEVARDTALLVDPYDVRQIAQAMWLVLSQPALAAELRAREPGSRGPVHLGAHRA